MERRIPTVFVTTHGAYPYKKIRDKIHIRYNIIPEDMTVYILEHLFSFKTPTMSA